MTSAKIMSFLETQGMSLLQGLMVLAVGLFLAHWIVKLIEKRQDKWRIEPTFRGFLANLIKWALYAVVILTTVNALGVPMTAVITLAASAGAAISLAMQGALGNLVGGVILLALRPIRVGEYVKIGDNEGTVKNIGAFYTDLCTPDNRHINLPNGSITNTAIVNFTREGTRRLDVVFSVAYQSDIDLVQRTLLEMALKNELLLSEPAPMVKLNEYADSSLKFVVRIWCKTADYWTIYFDLMDRGKRALDAVCVSIPYPQMDVHVKQD